MESLRRDLGDYAKVTVEQQKRIIEAYRRARAMSNDLGQCVGIAALEGFRLTTRQWNGKTGARAFAAALATLYMLREISLAEGSGVVRAYSGGAAS